MDNDMTGFIHTASQEVAINQTGAEYPPDPRITRIAMSRTKDGRYLLNIRFNPNNHHQVSKETGATLHWGKCKSYPDYLKMQESMAEHIGTPVEDFDTIRVDFTIDHMDEGTADRFKKLCDLMITCFTVRYNIGRKHQYRGTTIMKHEAKNTKARHGQLEIEVYNKSIQQERNGALWRQEIRHGVGTQPKAYAPHEHLQLMMEELEDQPDFYADACTMMNRHQQNTYKEDQAKTHHCIKRNSFIYDNRERFFSRGQVREFIAATGEVSNPDKATKNYFDRYTHETLTKNDLLQFVNGILAAIETYLTNEASFGEVIDIAKPVKAR